MAGPLVSCLCVSRPSRWGQLQRAVLDFLNQTYAERELVIAVDNATDFASTVQAFVDQQPRGPAIRVLTRPVRTQLEGLQWAAMSAYGSILTVWDDDNLNHPTRLEVQVAKQKDLPEVVTILTQGLYYFYENNELFAVDCFRPNDPAAARVLPTTIMAYRESFPVLDASCRARPTEQMVNNLARQGKRLLPIGVPSFLHMVCVAQDHVRGYETHRRIAQEKSRSSAWLTEHKDALKTNLDEYKWNGVAVSVEGRDAGAFSYTPKRKWPEDLYPVKLEPDPAPPTRVRPPLAAAGQPAKPTGGTEST